MKHKLAYIDAQGHFANPKYKNVRMPDASEVEDVQERRAMYENLPIRVFNARELDPAASIDIQGFQLVEQITDIDDLLDMERANVEFYAECSDVVKAVTGCTNTYVTQHQYRNGYGNLPEGRPLRARPTPNGSPGGYGGTHSDISPFAENRWDEIVDGRHCAMFNLWRSTDLQNDIEVMPLALLDMRTLDLEDMIAADAWGGAQAVQQHLVSYRLAHSEKHRWYYFPRMTPRDMLILKQYDTREENPCSRQVYHGAIRDPNTRDDFPLRNTIEVRVLALFERENDRDERKARYQAAVPDKLSDGTVSEWAWR